ncbi:MAG TPA: DUF5698 domain-containing protein [Anaerolineales bacterium]|nr:DUF5698 domain-containing protein [Anaerolineales bacterium]
MPDLSTLAPWLSALFIFSLRVIDMALDTLRFLLVVRGRKGLAWVMGFLQSAIFVVAITTVLSNLKNVWNIVGYAGGFATGVVVGMLLEERLAIGHGHMRIISSTRGAAIAEALRSHGYAVTEMAGRGKDGTVTVLNASVLRKDIDRVHGLVAQSDPSAFVTVQDVRPVRHGFWRA